MLALLSFSVGLVLSKSLKTKKQTKKKEEEARKKRDQPCKLETLKTKMRHMSAEDSQQDTL